jgi:hypothetical protein
MSCAPGATCNFACEGQNHYDCEATCYGGSTCTMTSTSYQQDTNFNCKSGSTCDLLCGPDGTCVVGCEEGSSCSVDVSGYHTVVQGTAFCAAGKTCDYSFINAYDNAALSVTCDGTCNFTTGQFQTKISNIDCRSGSTCTINCADGSNVCSYTCDSGATCTCTGAGTCTEL